jgi:hypothetical protein
MRAPAPAWREFRAGLLEPSWTGLLTALGVLLLALALLAAIVDESFVARWGQIDGDFDAMTTATALRLRTAPADRPVVVVFGSSQFGVALRRDGLARALARAGIDADVHKLTTAREPLPDVLALAGAVPDGARGVVVVEVSPLRFAETAREDYGAAVRYRLGLRSAAQDAVLRAAGLDPPARTGIYALDNAGFLLPRRRALLRNVLRRSATAHDWALFPPLSEADLHGRLMPLFRQRQSGYWREGEGNRALLGRIVAELRARTALEVLLVEYPLSPALFPDPALERMLAHHAGEMRRLAGATGAIYAGLERQPRFAQAEYRDWVHLGTESAVARETEAVAGLVAEAWPRAAAP